jgi:CRP-like cAMP-binding protein
MEDAELDDVLLSAASRRYAIGSTVFEQGQEASHFYVLLHGRLKVHQVTPAGQQIIVRIINPGDLCGIAKAMQLAHYPGTAVAAADSVLLAWPMASWDQLIASHPSFAANALRMVGARLQEAHTRIREMATEEVERRVAHAVLRLVQQAGQKEGSGVRIDFLVSRQDIAEMTGTTLYTVSRIFTAWEVSGLVEVGRQKLLVREPHRLVLIAEGQGQD